MKWPEYAKEDLKRVRAAMGEGKNVYTDEQRQKAMRALIEAGKEFGAIIRKVAPEFREIGRKLAATLEEITEGKK